MLRTVGYLALVFGVLAIIASYFFRVQEWKGAGLVSALAPLLAGVGALLVLLDKRRRSGR